MRRTWGMIGGGTALVLGTIAAVQGDLFSRTGEPAATATPPPAAAPESAAGDDAGAAEIARLTADLAARETEIAELRTTLAVRDAVLESLNATVAERDSALAELDARLAEREAELARLQAELALLRDPANLDAQLVAIKTDPVSSVARLAAVSAEDDLAAVFAAKAPAPMLPGAGRPSDEAPMVQVQFDFASSRLTPGGQAHAAAAAVTLAEMPLERIRVVGHTDRVGSPAANRRLATKRARAVADFLVAAGIPDDLIEVDGLGEADAPIPTDDGVAEPLNRSVAIIAIPSTTS